MPAETKAQQIRADIGTALAAITTDSTYHGPAPKVVHVDQFVKKHLKHVPKKRIFMVRDTSPEVDLQSESSFTQHMRLVTVFVLLLERLEKEWDPFQSSGASPGTLRDRMIADATIKLRADRTRSTLAVDTDILEPERDFEEPDGWIVAELPVVVKYCTTDSVV